jgi:hypothetical protein
MHQLIIPYHTVRPRGSTTIVTKSADDPTSFTPVGNEADRVQRRETSGSAYGIVKLTGKR